LSLYDVRGSEAKAIRLSVNLSELSNNVGGACSINSQNGHVTPMPLHTVPSMQTPVERSQTMGGKGQNGQKD